MVYLTSLEISSIFSIVGWSLVPATIAPAAHAFFIVDIKSSIPKAAIYAAVVSPAPLAFIVLKSGGTISIVPSRLINLAGKFDDVNKIYLITSDSISYLPHLH